MTLDEALIAHFGPGVTVRRRRAVAGGCINESAVLELSNGARCFLKEHPAPPPEMFAREAEGLDALRAAGALRVPEVYAVGAAPAGVPLVGAGVAPPPVEPPPGATEGRGGRADSSQPGGGPAGRPPSPLLGVPGTAGHPSASLRAGAGSGTRRSRPFLLMEAIDTGRPRREFWPAFGAALARLHGVTGDACGFDHDNYLGRLPQSNRRHARWREFFAAERLAFQRALARERGHLDAALDRALDGVDGALDVLLAHDPKPALLHGDLWSGNFLVDATGAPVLIDPAAYYGDPEADLAMTELFGGFPPAFYEGYESRRPLAPAYRAVRRDLYQLYHVLNHLNHFGGQYYGQSLALARRVTAAAR